MSNQALHSLVLALLNDEYGVSKDAYDQLRAMMLAASHFSLTEQRPSFDDILCAVRVQDGRFYLPDAFKSLKACAPGN